MPPYQIDRLDVKAEEAFLMLQAILEDLQAIKSRMDNRVINAGTIAPGTDASKFQISTAMVYKIDDVAHLKAATDDIAEVSASTQAGEYRKVLLSINAAGAVAQTAGAVAASQAAADLPPVPADQCPIGYLELPASFTGGTTSLTAGMCFDLDHEPFDLNATIGS